MLSVVEGIRTRIVAAVGFTNDRKR